MNTNIKVSQAQCKQIEVATRGQADNARWFSEGQKRLTSLSFGEVLKRRPKTPVTRLVRSLLYPTFTGNSYTRYGQAEEQNAVDEYILRKADEGINAKVYGSGLVIDKVNNFLASSPDGLVSLDGDEGLIEIKNVLKNKRLSLSDAAKDPSFCLNMINGVLCLKTTHNYYYQCQGAMHICDKPWLDFVVRTKNPHQLFIQRISRDGTLWDTMMLPKLRAFYMQALLPELCCPREGKCPGIREPGPDWVLIFIQHVVLYKSGMTCDMIL
jgi:hypothetical protein